MTLSEPLLQSTWTNRALGKTRVCVQCPAPRRQAQNGVVSSCEGGEMASQLRGSGPRREAPAVARRSRRENGRRGRRAVSCDAISFPRGHFAVTPQPALCCAPCTGPELTVEADGSSSSGCWWGPRRRAASYDGFQLKRTEQLSVCSSKRSHARASFLHSKGFHRLTLARHLRHLIKDLFHFYSISFLLTQLIEHHLRTCFVLCTVREMKRLGPALR